MTSREQRRAQLQQEPDLIEGYKEDPLKVTDKVSVGDIIAKLPVHLKRIIVPALHVHLADVRLLNEEEITQDFKEQFVCIVEATFVFEEKEYYLELEVPVHIDVRSTQRHAKYYEAIVQLRDFDGEQMDAIKQAFVDEGMVISKIVPQKLGIDLYVDDNHRAQALVRKLKRRWPGTIKQTAKLFSVDNMTSKLQYRVTILYRKK